MGELQSKFSLNSGFKDWTRIMEFINTKRTHEKAFQNLFAKILENENHKYHLVARQLNTLYDFTPLRSEVAEPL